MAQLPVRRRFDRAELARAASSRAELASVVTASGGHALVEMRALGLMPRLDDLMAVVDGDSLSFLLDHYELGLEQKRALAPLFSEQLGSAKLAGAELSETEVDALLDAGRPWIKGAQVTRRQLAERPGQLRAALDASDDGEMERAVGRTMSKMPVDAIMRLDDRLWEGCLSLVAGRADVLAHPEGKARYKRMVLASAARDGALPRWSEFASWSFGADDAEFFWALVGDDKWSPPTYGEIVAAPGCSAFVDKLGYARRVRPGSLAAFDPDELAASMEAVRGVWMDFCAKGKGYNEPASFDATVAQFEAVVDVEWMARGMREVPRMLARLDMGDSPESRAKARWMRRQALRAFLADPIGVVAAQGTYEIVGMAEALLEGSRAAPEGEPADSEIAETAIEAVLPFCVDATDEEGASRLTSPGRLAGDRCFGALAKASRSAPSSNLLWMLLAAAQERREKERHARHGEEAFLGLAVLASLGAPPESGRLLWDAYAPRARRRMKPRFGASSGAGDPRADLMGASFRGIFELPRSARSALMAACPRFAEKMREAGAMPDQEMLIWALRAVADAPGRGSTLLRKLMALAGPSCLSHPEFASQLRAHPRAADLVDLKLLPPPPDAVAQTREIARALGQARRAQEDCWAGARASGLGQGAEAEARAEALSAAARRLDQAGRDLFGALPHAQAREALGSALAQGAYDFFEDCSKWRSGASGAKEMWEVHARSMPVDAFCVALGDPAFAGLMRGSVDYGDESSMGLDFGSARANARACERLLPLFDADSCGALALFSAGARAVFAAGFAVDKMARRALYSYRLTPGRGGLVPGRYAPDQIVRLFDHLEAEGGFFCAHDVNARVGGMFRENFKDDPEAFLAALGQARSRPKLYALLFNSDLFDEFGARREEPESKGAKQKARDAEPRESRHAPGVRWAADHVDWEVVLAGLESILDEAWERRGEEAFNPKLAVEAVREPIWASRATGVNDLPGDPDGYALLSEELSLRLANMLLRKAPLLFYGARGIGAIPSLPARFEQDPGAFDCPEMVERLFFPDRSATPEHFDLRQWARAGVVSVCAAAVAWLAREGRARDVELVDWTLKEAEFRESELDYGERKSEVPGFPGSTDGALECCAQSPEFMGALRVAVEKLSLEELVDRTPARRRAAGRL